MSDHKFTVEEPDRVICFSLTSEEAKAAFDWLNNAHAALKQREGVFSPSPPHILSELLGGFSAIAENRGYGGH